MGLLDSVQGNHFLLSVYVLSMFALCFIHWGREAWQYQMEINSLLDLQDTFCDSEVQSQNAAMFSDEQNAGTRNNRSIEETSEIQTGLAPDIEAHLMRRRNRKPPPDDLAEL
jgi:hypothetical protein